MAQENADFFALPHEGPSSPRDDRHEHPWSLRRVYHFFWPRISLPPFHEIPAADMEVSVDDGVENASSGVSSSRVVDSMHPCSLTNWTDIPPARVHFICIDSEGVHHGPFDLPFGDVMKEGFSSFLHVSIRRLLFSISSLPPAPRISMEYNAVIFSLGNLMILLTKQKSLLFFFDAKETARYMDLAHFMVNNTLLSKAPYPMNVYVLALRTSLDWYIGKAKSLNEAANKLLEDAKSKGSSSTLAMEEQQQSIRACVDLLMYVVSAIDAVFVARDTILPQMLFTSIENPNIEVLQGYFQTYLECLSKNVKLLKSVSQGLEVYGRHVSIKKEEKARKINELQLALTCFGFLLTIFFGYPTLYIDIKDGQLSLTSVGLVSLLLVFLLGFAYKVLKFMGLIC